MIGANLVLDNLINLSAAFVEDGEPVDGIRSIVAALRLTKPKKRAYGRAG
ncbi:hypothetical protein [Pseudopelagicola sp. nBUS_19]